jgi:NADPH-dependent 7-cyano-7-deazaguanine reductase QueF
MIHEQCIVEMYTIIVPTNAPKYITVSLLVCMQNKLLHVTANHVGVVTNIVSERGHKFGRKM